MGKAKINILTLAIAYEGVAIPIFWCLLNKAGNATAVEHRAMLVRFIRIIGNDCITGFLEDREFASAKIFAFCNDERIPFYIRIKEGSLVKVKNKKLFKAKCLFAQLNLSERLEFQMVVSVYGQTVYLAGSRLNRGELMIIATNQPKP